MILQGNFLAFCQFYDNHTFKVLDVSLYLLHYCFRWIIGGRTTSESSVDSLKVPSSLVEKTNSPLISDNRIPRGPQVDR